MTQSSMNSCVDISDEAEMVEEVPHSIGAAMRIDNFERPFCSNDDNFQVQYHKAYFYLIARVCKKLCKSEHYATLAKK